MLRDIWDNIGPYERAGLVVGGTLTAIGVFGEGAFYLWLIFVCVVVSYFFFTR